MLAHKEIHISSKNLNFSVPSDFSSDSEDDNGSHCPSDFRISTSATVQAKLRVSYLNCGFSG